MAANMGVLGNRKKEKIYVLLTTTLVAIIHNDGDFM